MIKQALQEYHFFFIALTEKLLTQEEDIQAASGVFVSFMDPIRSPVLMVRPNQLLMRPTPAQHPSTQLMM